ncbi:MAG: hypothetical protein DDG59_08860 [Anaerolineae bacterium]|jgi:hypothetical protein|nr:MAG: hypothetical protein DDG59_08860 [Anaerolineae bacterium]
MEYGQILRRAWQITWKYKFLWVFGIAIALCRGQGGGNGANFNFGNNFPREGNRNGDIPISPEVMRGIQQFINSPAFWGLIVGLIVLILVLTLLSIAVGAYARGVLVRSVNRIENGEILDFRQAWEEGKPSFRPLFWLELILSLPSLAIGLSVLTITLVILLNLIRSGALSRGAFPDEIAGQVGLLVPLAIVAFCGLICLGLIIQLFVAIFTVFGSRAIALEGHSVTASFGRAWQVFTKNLAPVVLFALILFGINLLVGIVIAIPLAIFVGMILVMGIGAAMSGLWPILVVLALGLVFVIALLSIGVGGIYRVYAETLWTLVYRQLVGLAQPPEPPSTPSSAPELTSP